MRTMKVVDILLIIPPFHMRNGGSHFFPLGTGYIISSLQKMQLSYDVINCTEIIRSFYETDLVYLAGKLEERLREYHPCVIGIGPCVTTQLKALRVISEICSAVQPEIPLFAGGPFATINGQATVFSKILGINYLIKGDGEIAVPLVVKYCKEHNNIADCPLISTMTRSYINRVDDLNVLPFPYRTTRKPKLSVRREMEQGHSYPMITSRGCPYRCRYCVSGNLKDSGITNRYRNYDNIIAEMIELRDHYDAEEIVFYDDLFFHDLNNLNQEVDRFCFIMNENQVHLKWQIEMRPDFFCDLSTRSLLTMYQNGCKQVNLGIEKVSEKGLSFLGKPTLKKNLAEKIQEAHSIGIRISATFILGGKGESKDDIENIISYAKSLQLDFAHFNPLFVYPGTPLYDEMFHNQDDWAQMVINDSLPWGEILYDNGILSTSDLLELVEKAYKEFYTATPYEESMMVTDRFNLRKL